MKCIGPFLHKWGKWEDITIISGVTPTSGENFGKRIEVDEPGQLRICKDCDKKQRKFIRRF